MAIRTEQTLRRMWNEATDNQTDATKLMDACKSHASAADDAGRTARAHQNEAAKAKLAADEFAAQAADLVDMVNEKRSAMGLSPLTPGEPYPADPAPAGVVPAEQPMADDTLVASGQSAATTAVDGQGVTGEVTQ